MDLSSSIILWIKIQIVYGYYQSFIIIIKRLFMFIIKDIRLLC